MAKNCNSECPKLFHLPNFEDVFSGENGNCGVHIPRVADAPSSQLQELKLGDPDAMDLEVDIGDHEICQENWC